ncbi:MAG TPA: Gfo/Idh/MocA family oxidoreductase [Pseudonocardiaceae bacterium]|nr:Gfo/Idh/MocA family oxidoreductase [Pseudonocardiaceae bacterium]
MNRPLRLGVVGCSSIAWRRALPAVCESDRVTLVAVASRDKEKAKRFAEHFDCDATDYLTLVARDDIDAVYLPLPPSLHLEWGSAVLRAGKHLLCEKPIATTAAEAGELIGVAQEAGLVLRENFTFLHHSQHAAVSALMDEGRLGEPRSFTASFCFPPLPETDIRYVASLGGGSLLDAGVYPIRAAQLLLGNDLMVVGASLRMGDGVDLAGQAQLVSADGVFVSAQFGFQHSYASRYELWGSTARLNLERAFTPPADRSPLLRITGQDGTEGVVLPADHQFRRSVESFADAVLAGHGPAHVDERRWSMDSLRTMELVDEIRTRAVLV